MASPPNEYFFPSEDEDSLEDELFTGHLFGV